MSIIITPQMIEQTISRIESTPPDLSPEIRVGDWVQLNDPNRGEAYRQGHVKSITKSGVLLAYGGRDLPSYLRLHLFDCNTPVPVRSVSEVWRKVDVVNREEWNGGTVTSIEAEWQQVR